MGVQIPEWKDRIGHWIKTLEKDLYHPIGEIQWEMFLTMEELKLEEVKKQQFFPVETGTVWGHTWEYGWFRGKVKIPRQAKGERIVVDLQAGGEATVFVNDQTFGTYRADWIEEPHHYLEDNYLTRCAREGEEYEIYMEVYAGHHFPTYGVNTLRATGPLWEGDYEDPLTEGKRRVVGKSTFGIWQEEAYQLYMDVKTLEGLLLSLDETSLRAAKIEEALENFTLQVEFEQDIQGRKNDYKKAREALRPVLEAKNGSTMPRFYAVGNAHIDLAWLWPVAETRRKTARTFAAQLRLLEEYPDYRFIQSQPEAYEMCREYYPDLFARIVEAAKEGRWIVDGAMWVEPDTNMSSGESLIRQLLYGKKYYKEVFGVNSQVLWLPDSFGYTAALPQILKGCGVKYLVTQKVFWSYNGGEQFPYHYFYWEGMDGTKLTSFLPTSYTYKTSPAEANNAWKNRGQMRDLEVFLYPFGYGDGGGGPCRDHIEYAKRYENLEGCVRMQMTSPQQFFEEMEAEGGPKHTYVGELYLTAHRGTYTTQALMKKNNRRAEICMHNLELWSTFASLAGGEKRSEMLEKMWKVVLFHQFHDILPGTAIARVYEEAAKAFETLYQQSEEMSQEIFETLTEKEGYSVWNPLGFERNAVITLPEIFKHGVLVDGNPVCVSCTETGVRAAVTLPACGTVSLEPAIVEQEKEKAIAVETEEGFCLENGYLRAIVNSKGEVISLRLKEDGWNREYAAKPMNHFQMYKDIPRRYDSWDIDSTYREQEIVEAVSNVSCRILNPEGAEAVLEVCGLVGTSPYRQQICLASNGKRVEFRTTVDWKEQHRLWKVAFPIEVYGENGINETQFGYVQHPTHRSRQYDQDRYEVCNHRYSALCDQNHGAALLNDCKYGISMNGNVLELTLLRGAVVPDRHADQGIHTFTYAIYPWSGSFYDSETVWQGYELNVEPKVVPGRCESFSAITLDKKNIILDTVKMAEDGSGDLILRMYESKKADTDVSVKINLEHFRAEVESAQLCDLLENKQSVLECEDGEIKLHFRAFEIKTLRINWKKCGE